MVYSSNMSWFGKSFVVIVAVIFAKSSVADVTVKLRDDSKFTVWHDCLGNCRPVPYNQTVTMNEPVPGDTFEYRVKSDDIDGDTATYHIKSQPENGTVTMAPDGSYVYTPGTGVLYGGNDSFTYVATDSNGNQSWPGKVDVVRSSASLLKMKR
jgi:hypothetical protein